METTEIQSYRVQDIAGEALDIVVYPDPVLKKVAEPVTEFGPHLKKLAEDMLFTMYQAPGIGLAAPQIGKSIRMFVLDVDYDREVVTLPDGTEEDVYTNFNPHVFINPVLKNKEGTFTYQEGCLSLPGIYDDVERFERLTLEYQDWEGNKQSMDVEGIFSVCVQHENDHLDGVVFIERLSNIKRNLYKKKLIKEKKRREY